MFGYFHAPVPATAESVARAIGRVVGAGGCVLSGTGAIMRSMGRREVPELVTIGTTVIAGGTLILGGSAGAIASGAILGKLYEIGIDIGMTTGSAITATLAMLGAAATLHLIQEIGETPATIVVFMGIGLECYLGMLPLPEAERPRVAIPEANVAEDGEIYQDANDTIDAPIADAARKAEKRAAAEERKAAAAAERAAAEARAPLIDQAIKRAAAAQAQREARAAEAARAERHTAKQEKRAAAPAPEPHYRGGPRR